jgi:hypothetical protein
MSPQGRHDKIRRAWNDKNGSGGDCLPAGSKIDDGLRLSPAYRQVVALRARKLTIVRREVRLVILRINKRWNLSTFFIQENWENVL